jgi:hypothetical protein
MVISSLLVFLVNILCAQIENHGIKIVTHQTVSSDFFSEQTIYIAGDRRRMEVRHSVARRNDGTSPETSDGLSSVIIVRCDLGQSFILHPQREEYSSSPYPPERLTIGGKLLAMEKPASDEVAKPTLRIETTTVDTGERQEMFGYVAKHVIYDETNTSGGLKLAALAVGRGWLVYRS